MKATDSSSAIVLGATGHIGNAVVRELLSRGWQVTATSRKPDRAANLRELDVDYVHGAPAGYAHYREWFAGHDLVVDAATPYPVHLFDVSGARRTPMESATERMTQIVRAAASHGATVACVSSFTTVVETSIKAEPSLMRMAAPIHPYFGVKRAIERVVLDAAERGQPCLLINPTLCLGPWDVKPRELTMLPFLASREVPVAPDQILNVIDVRDVARMMVNGIEARVFGRRLLCAGHNVKFAELARRAGDLARSPGSGPTTVDRNTADLGAAGAMWMELLFAGVGRNSPVPSLALMLLRQHRALEPGPEQRRLNAPARALDETLIDSLAWYATLGYC